MGPCLGAPPNRYRQLPTAVMLCRPLQQQVVVWLGLDGCMPTHRCRRARPLDWEKLTHLDEGASPDTGSSASSAGCLAVSSIRMEAVLLWVCTKMRLPIAAAWKREMAGMAAPCMLLGFRHAAGSAQQGPP